MESKATFLKMMNDNENMEIYSSQFTANDESCIVISVNNVSEQPTYTDNNGVLSVNGNNTLPGHFGKGNLSSVGASFGIPKSKLKSAEPSIHRAEKNRKKRQSVSDVQQLLGEEPYGTLIQTDLLDHIDPNEDFHSQRIFNNALCDELPSTEAEFATTICDGHHDPLSEDADPDLQQAISFLNSPTSEDEVEFLPLDTDKKRNPPYMLKEGSKGIKIASKNHEPVKFCHRGAKLPGDTITASLRYSEEKHKSVPVHACLLHRIDSKNDSNFMVSSAGINVGNTKWELEEIIDHPTASFTFPDNITNFYEDFIFFVTFKCLNSCHKDYGKKMELILQHIKKDGCLYKENRFEVRVCKNVKRDYKEAFEEQQNSGKRKRHQRDEMKTPQYQEKSQPGPSTSQENEINERTAKLQMCEEKIKKEVPRDRSQQIFPPQPPNMDSDIYWFKVPTEFQEHIILGIIKEFGGVAYRIQSVFPAGVGTDTLPDN
ncbi:hypothetical protein SK128_025290 [Halocaridina rubra]|uniref:p53 DNA-binding domain-containing protein n=1 Tax=Halocaridina rubra TaxID=373956 RepID=A0AAN8WLA6_HALRR